MEEPNQFILSLMLAVYTREVRGLRQDNDENVYLETHEVYEHEGVKKLGEGKPLTRQALQDLEEYFASAKKRNTMRGLLKGVIPKNILYMNQDFSSNRLVWWVEGKRRKISFDRTAINKSGYQNGEFFYPHLVFMVDGKNDLTVFAVKEKPTMKTKLFYAPFLNVYQNATICLGTAPLNVVTGAKTFEQYLQAWEDVFFVSRFSHGVASFKTIVKCGDLAKLTKKLVKKPRPFPSEELSPIDKNECDYLTIEDLCS